MVRKALQFVVIALVIASALPAVAGTISGRITNPKKCSGVQALLREGKDVKYPCLPKIFRAEYDAKTGEFKIRNLPKGRYDLRILVHGGYLDGVDMRLEELDEEEDAEPFSKEDEKAIREFIADYPDRFSDIIRPLVVRGNGRYAKVIVEKIRARQFHSGAKGEITWRVEVWQFEKQTGAWARTPRGTEVVSRVRVFNTPTRQHNPKNRLHMLANHFEPLVWNFFAAIGGLELEKQQSIVGLKIAVPKLNTKHGKVAGSVKQQVEEFLKKDEEDKHLD